MQLTVAPRPKHLLSKTLADVPGIGFVVSTPGKLWRLVLEEELDLLAIEVMYAADEEGVEVLLDRGADPRLLAEYVLPHCSHQMMSLRNRLMSTPGVTEHMLLCFSDLEWLVNECRVHVAKNAAMVAIREIKLERGE